MVLRLIFGYYIDIGTKYTAFLSKCYCLFLFLVNLSSYILIFARNTKLNNADSYNLLEILVNCAMALVFKSKYIQKTINLLKLSSELLEITTISVPWKISVYLVLTLCFRLYSFFVYTEVEFPSLPYFVALALITSSYINYNANILVFIVVRHQMKLLRQKFDFKYMAVNVIGRERCDYKINNIKKCLDIYKILLTSVVNMDYQIEIWVSSL